MSSLIEPIQLPIRHKGDAGTAQRGGLAMYQHPNWTRRLEWHHQHPVPPLTARSMLVRPH
jgi:hypothetical protein